MKSIVFITAYSYRCRIKCISPRANAPDCLAAASIPNVSEDSKDALIDNDKKLGDFTEQGRPPLSMEVDLVREVPTKISRSRFSLLHPGFELRVDAGMEVWRGSKSKPLRQPAGENSRA